MNATDLSEIRYCITAVLVLHQPEVPSFIETAASDIDIPVEVTGCHTQPVIMPVTEDLSR